MKSKITIKRYNGLIQWNLGVSMIGLPKIFRGNFNKYEVSNIKVISQEVFLSCIEGEMFKCKNLKKIDGVSIGEYK